MLLFFHIIFHLIKIPGTQFMVQYFCVDCEGIVLLQLYYSLATSLVPAHYYPKESFSATGV